jgi:hypothetical protein
MMHQMARRLALPRLFCWTRYGTEAGESIQAILARKDAERLANDGVFLWGIGNSIAPALSELLRRVKHPEVLFSPIKSPPRRVDVAPARVVRWTSAEGLSGDAFKLPQHTTVTSSWSPARRMAGHYALVCHSDGPLEIATAGTLSFNALRNLRSGAPLGASQVTAVVSRADTGRQGGDYPVAFRAALVAPYFVRLGQPESV